MDALLHLESHEVFAGNNALDPTLERKGVVTESDTHDF